MEEMTLVFVRGAADVRIRVDGTLDRPYEARFGGRQPDVRELGSRVEIEHRWGLLGLDWRHQSADIVLNPRMAWHIVVRGGLSRLTADLRGLRLLGLTVTGGASQVELQVDDPVGQVPVTVGGGASRLHVVRPTGSAASVAIGGGASRLTLDAQRFGAIGGRTRLETCGYQATEDRLDLIVSGGASQVALTAA